MARVEIKVYQGEGDSFNSGSTRTREETHRRLRRLWRQRMRCWEGGTRLTNELINLRQSVNDRAVEQTLHPPRVNLHTFPVGEAFRPLLSNFKFVKNWG